MKHYRVEQNSVEWYQLRLGMPTASSFAKILTPKTLAKSKQADDYRDKLIAERISGEPMDLYSSDWMQRGLDTQDDAIRSYELETMAETDAGGFFTNDAGTAGASPDRLAGSRGLVEIKCPLLHTQVGVALTEDNLEDYRIQLQGQLWITERDWVDIYSYHPLLLLPPRRMYRDEDLLRTLRYVLEVFIADLEKQWERLNQERGPFKRQGTVAPAIPIEYPDWLQEQDVEPIIAAVKAKQVKP